MTPYSPDRRTALVFSGTGVHGAYHAGVLRALQEAGVKIDVVAGQGVGAGAAALAAIDGASRLWDPDGVWGGAPTGLYGWKRSVRAAGRVLAVLGAVVAFPLVFLAAGLVVYPFALLLQIVGLDAGGAMLGVYSQWLLTLFTGESLPTILPRLAMVVLMALAVLLLGATLRARWRAPARRRSTGGRWWRLLEGPVDVDGARGAFGRVIQQLVGGAVPGTTPALGPLGQRYAGVLVDNLGQPGFRELLLVASDLDTRQDLIGALLREPYRGAFLAPREGRERGAEVLDLAGADGGPRAGAARRGADASAGVRSPDADLRRCSVLAGRDAPLVRSARGAGTPRHRTGGGRRNAGDHSERRRARKPRRIASRRRSSIPAAAWASL